MAVVRLDKIAGTHLASIVGATDMTNGLFVQLGDLVEGSRETYNAEQATVATLGDEFVLHATPEVMYDPRKAGLKDFVLEAGDVGRAYHLTKGDVITLTGDLFASTPVVGQYAIPQVDSMTLDASVDKTDGLNPEPSLVFEVIEETTLGYDMTTAYALRVIKA